MPLGGTHEHRPWGPHCGNFHKRQPDKDFLNSLHGRLDTDADLLIERTSLR